MTIYVDEKKFLDNEHKTRVILNISNKLREVYLNDSEIRELQNSNKLIIQTKTFTDKIMDELNKVKPGICKE